jgi:hypothetical protein
MVNYNMKLNLEKIEIIVIAKQKEEANLYILNIHLKEITNNKCLSSKNHQTGEYKQR